MFLLGDVNINNDEVMLEVIRIICEDQNASEIPKGFNSHTEAAGRHVIEYLWRIGILRVIKDEPKGQMTLDEFINGKKE